MTHGQTQVVKRRAHLVDGRGHERQAARREAVRHEAAEVAIDRRERALERRQEGLGDVATTVASVDDTSKIVLSVAMVLGRLEIFTLLVLLSPSIWRG